MKMGQRGSNKRHMQVVFHVFKNDLAPNRHQRGKQESPKNWTIGDSPKKIPTKACFLKIFHQSI